MRKLLDMRAFIFIISLAFTVFGLTSCREGTQVGPNRAVNTPVNSAKSGSAVPKYTYEIVNTYKHDSDAFTQGLQFYNGLFYETTGGRKSDPFHSSLRKVEVTSGKVLQKYDLPGEYFGEGMTIFGGKIYQITWQEHVSFVYDLETFKLLKEFKYQGEGWGLTGDGKNLIMSDGTHVIRFVDPETFQTVRTISVFDAQGQPLMELNELEYIKGEIWANIWGDDVIARIDPASGKLLGTIDFAKLVKEMHDSSDKAEVLNGIAYDEANDRIFITGKQWKKLFEIRIKPE